MKAITLFLIATLAVTACERDSSAKSDGERRGGADMATSAPHVAGRPLPAPPPSEAAATVGRIAGQAADEYSTRPQEGTTTDATSTNPLQYVTPGTTVPTMVIRTGQAFIEVEKVDAAELKIRQLAAQVGGYITNSSMTGGRDQVRQATFELKIPAPRYEAAVGSLSTIGKVETVSTNAQDVGEEFVDVTARVNNSRRLEERLIGLLANRTGKLDEVLRVERELARVREEIERYEGRLRYLTSRVALSTLTITVHEPAPILGSNPGENPIAAALRRAWRNFVALLSAAIASLGVLIPLGLVGFAGWIAYRRWKRR